MPLNFWPNWTTIKMTELKNAAVAIPHSEMSLNGDKDVVL